MVEILSVKQGDRFESRETTTTLEVTKIWFEFSQADQRWETSVTWNVNYHTSNENHQLSGKARDFVKILRDFNFVHVAKPEESGATMAPVSPQGPDGPYVTLTDSKQRKWEDDFRRNAVKYGLLPSDLGRKVTLSSNKPGHFTIVGAKPGNWKMPILIKGKRGGIYKITAQRAKSGLV